MGHKVSLVLMKLGETSIWTDKNTKILSHVALNQNTKLNGTETLVISFTVTSKLYLS
jgi:hypothetical protein